MPTTTIYPPDYKFVSDSKFDSVKNIEDFNTVSEEILNTYYRKPFPNGWPRVHHGQLHAVCTVYCLDLLLALTKKHTPQLIEKLNEGQQLTERGILFLRYGALMHDSANNCEAGVLCEPCAMRGKPSCEDCSDQTKRLQQETKQADNFEKFMLSKTSSNSSIVKVKEAMANKDNINVNTIQRILLQSADCMEYNRLLINSGQFLLDRLDVYKLFKDNLATNTEKFKAAESELKNILAHYFKLRHYLQAHFSNAVQQGYDAYYPFIINKIDSWLLFGRFNYATDIIDLLKKDYFDHFDNILAKYSPDILVTAINIIMQHNYLYTNEAVNAAKCNDLMEYYKQYGLFMRILKTTNITDIIQKFNTEISVINTNAKEIIKNNLEDVKQLRASFSEHDKSSAKIKFRPSTYIKSGYPILPYIFNNWGVLLNPKSVRAAFHYKRNINSNIITSEGNFDYKRPQRVKELGSLKALSEKIDELEQRRRGAKTDNNNRVLGSLCLPHNECLLTYQAEDILGIVIIIDKEISSFLARAAIIARLIYRQCLNLVLPIYCYHPLLGLISITDMDLLRVIYAHSNPLKSYFSEFYQKKLLAVKQANELSIVNANMIMESIEREEKEENGKKSIIYTFKYWDQNKTCNKAKAYIADGIPIIEIAGKRYIDNCNIYRTIDALYLISQVEAYNDDLLNNELFRQVINLAFGISGIKLDFCISSSDKQCFWLFFTPKDNRKIDYSRLLSALGYNPIFYKWEVVRVEEKNCVRLSVPSTILEMRNFLHKSNNSFRYESVRLLESWIELAISQYLAIPSSNFKAASANDSSIKITQAKVEKFLKKQQQETAFSDVFIPYLIQLLPGDEFAIIHNALVSGKESLLKRYFCNSANSKIIYRQLFQQLIMEHNHSTLLCLFKIKESVHPEHHDNDILDAKTLPSVIQYLRDFSCKLEIPLLKEIMLLLHAQNKIHQLTELEIGEIILIFIHAKDVDIVNMLFDAILKTESESNKHSFNNFEYLYAKETTPFSKAAQPIAEGIIKPNENIRNILLEDNTNNQLLLIALYILSLFNKDSAKTMLDNLYEDKSRMYNFIISKMFLYNKANMGHYKIKMFGNLVLWLQFHYPECLPVTVNNNNLLHHLSTLHDDDNAVYASFDSLEFNKIMHSLLACQNFDITEQSRRDQLKEEFMQLLYNKRYFVIDQILAFFYKNDLDKLEADRKNFLFPFIMMPGNKSDYMNFYQYTQHVRSKDENNKVILNKALYEVKAAIQADPKLVNSFYKFFQQWDNPKRRKCNFKIDNLHPGTVKKALAPR